MANELLLMMFNMVYFLAFSYNYTYKIFCQWNCPTELVPLDSCLSISWTLMCVPIQAQNLFISRTSQASYCSNCCVNEQTKQMVAGRKINSGINMTSHPIPVPNLKLLMINCESNLHSLASSGIMAHATLYMYTNVEEL